MTRLAAVVVASVFTITGCQAAAPALSDADVQANQAVTDQFAELLVARNLTALVELYAEGAVVMPPNGPAVAGRERILAWQESSPPVSSFVATNDVIDGGGDVVYVRGHYALVLAIEGTPADTGKYVGVRKRQPDGSWKIIVDIFNSDLPLPGPEDS
jgi:ketosteroid isomerase-like protein